MTGESFKVENINIILSKTIEAIEESKEAIFEIAENARKECVKIKRQLEDIKDRIQCTMKEVTEIEVLEKNSRRRLLEVSRDFNRYKENDIKIAYEKASELQIKLLFKRQEEGDLIRSRSELELRYKSSEDILKKAEDLTSKIGVTLEYLSGSLQGITNTLEDIQERQAIGRNIIRAQEVERQRVAREIHDGPAQSLANVLLKAELSEKLIEIDKEKAKIELQDLRRVLREGVKDIRKIIYNLRPMSLDDIGFLPTIQRFIETFQEENKIYVDFTIHSQVTLEDPIKNLTIFRIIQESLNNVRKYANAAKVQITLEIGRRCIILSIVDDGVGFNSSDNNYQLSEDGGFGLLNIKERVELLKGTVKISSEINKGTQIYVNIPNEE